MALRADELDRDPIYQRYLAALRRHGVPDPEVPSPGHAIRNCASCGQHTMFRLDPEGTWYECMRCGHYA